MSTDGPSEQAIENTHNALFDTWFPLDQLPLPPAVKPEIAAIAAQVKAGMWKVFSAPPPNAPPPPPPPVSPMMKLLAGMTWPKFLPFYDCLEKNVHSPTPNPAVKAFLAADGGYGGMPADQREPLFSFLFEGSAGPVSTMVAMILREAYLSGIWDLPLAVPLTQILPPAVFMPNPEIYSQLHVPTFPPSRLYYDSQSHSIKHKDGVIDYIVVGSGPGGAAVAYELWKAGKRVVLIEKGPWVIWGSMDTRSYPKLMFKGDTAATADNGIILRSGETMGGGTTVNIDLAFSPLEATIQARVDEWKKEGRIDARFYTQEDLAAAYKWVRDIIKTRQLSQHELNQDNLVLWDGAEALGVDPKLYHLNRYRVGYSPSPVDDKRDAARQLIMPAAMDKANPLSVIPDAIVEEVLFAPTDGQNVTATGVVLTMQKPWTDFGNTIVDPSNLKIPPETTVTCMAENVILAGGTIGTTQLLLKTAKKNPAIDNPQIGRGLILHPSMPLVGVFDKEINLLEGLDSATFVDAFGVMPGFIYETMGGLPAYGALLIPGNGRQVYDILSGFNMSAGFGVMLVDTPSPDNRITLDDKDEPVLTYTLSEDDKERFATGVALGVRMMFLAKAKTVIVPSNENLLGESDFDPMHGVFLCNIEQADCVKENLKFVPNRTMLTAAHIQAANKIGPSPDSAVVSTRQRVWNVLTREEVPNLYIMDSSIFPTSVGANPMQSIYTFAKIFADRLIYGIDNVRAALPLMVSQKDAEYRAGYAPAAVVAADG
jgi:hypothetical protein